MPTLGVDVLSTEEFEERVQSFIDRHRAGYENTVRREEQEVKQETGKGKLNRVLILGADVFDEEDVPEPSTEDVEITEQKTTRTAVCRCGNQIGQHGGVYAVWWHLNTNASWCADGELAKPVPESIKDTEQ
jgi:hypothetical protein